MSAVSYEKTLEKEIAGIRLEIAELRTETQTSIAELRAEMKADFADVHREISGLHENISAIHKDIAIQTRWILIGLTAAVTLYPIITRLVERLVP